MLIIFINSDAQIKNAKYIIYGLPVIQNVGIGEKSMVMRKLVLSFKEVILQELDLTNNHSLYVDIKKFYVNNVLINWGIGELKDSEGGHIVHKIYNEKKVNF